MNMTKPNDVAGVRRIVGVVNYLSKFLPKLSDICEPLRTLTHQNVMWSWTHEQDEALKQLKKAITQTPVLRYFNSAEEVILQCDASSIRLGAALLQNGQPVEYASRSLTSTERYYAQIEKELLAIIFRLEHFDQYTCR